MKTAHEFARELLAGPDLPISLLNPRATSAADALVRPDLRQFVGFESMDDNSVPIDQIEIYSGEPTMGIGIKRTRKDNITAADRLRALAAAAVLHQLVLVDEADLREVLSSANHIISDSHENFREP